MEYTTLENVVAMTALPKASLAEGDVVRTLGYASAGDGGHGTYRWDASSEATVNGGSVHMSGEGGPGRWLLVHNGRVNVAVFGFLPSQTDSHVSRLQAAIDAHDTLTIDPGYYVCSHPLRLRASTDIEANGAILAFSSIDPVPEIGNAAIWGFGHWRWTAPIGQEEGEIWDR